MGEEMYCPPQHRLQRQTNPTKQPNKHFPKTVKGKSVELLQLQRVVILCNLHPWNHHTSFQFQCLQDPCIESHTSPHDDRTIGLSSSRSLSNRAIIFSIWVVSCVTPRTHRPEKILSLEVFQNHENPSESMKINQHLYQIC